MRRLLVASILSVTLAGPALADAAGDLKLGREALKRSDYSAAVTKLSSAIDSGGLKGERLGEAYRMRAAAQFQQRDLRQAFADVSEAVKANARDSAALGLRCQIHVAGGNAAAAEADLTAARAINANSGPAQVCEAGALLRQRRFADSVAAYDRAIQLGEDTPDLRANRAITLAMAGKPDEALAALEKVIAAGRSAGAVERAGWHADRARLYAALKRPEPAIKDLDEALKLDPNSREATERYFLRARLNNDAGKFDQALADLNKVIEREQSAPDARKALLFATRGTSYAAKGEFDRAIADIDGALSLAKDVPPAVVGNWYVIRARANRAAGRVAPALQDYATALKQSPDNVEILGERGDFLLRQGNADQAMADFQAAVQKAPANPATHSWLGWGYAEKSNYPKAIEFGFEGDRAAAAGVDRLLGSRRVPVPAGPLLGGDGRPRPGGAAQPGQRQRRASGPHRPHPGGRQRPRHTGRSGEGSRHETVARPAGAPVHEAGVAGRSAAGTEQDRQCRDPVLCRPVLPAREGHQEGGGAVPQGGRHQGPPVSGAYRRPYRTGAAAQLSGRNSCGSRALPQCYSRGNAPSDPDDETRRDANA